MHLSDTHEESLSKDSKIQLAHAHAVASKAWKGGCDETEHEVIGEIRA